METTPTTALRSDADLSNLATSNIGVIAEYAFSNPDSINGPFGTMRITLSSGAAQETATGEININTLWGLGTVTNLSFNGTAGFNGSTGYTTVNADSHGTITVRPNPPRYITAKVSISLQPGFQQGTLSVEGFFTGFTIKATAIHYISGN